jgi:hypothetical protein
MKNKKHIMVLWQKIPRFARNDGEAKGKEKAISGGFAAANRPHLSHAVRHVDRRETSVETITD